jgi:hypothetical protein
VFLAFELVLRCDVYYITIIIYYIIIHTLLNLILYSSLLFPFLLSLSFIPPLPIYHPSFPHSPPHLSSDPRYSFYTCRYLHILIYIPDSSSNNSTPHKLSEGCLEWWSFICVVFGSGGRILVFRVGVVLFVFKSIVLDIELMGVIGVSE